MRILLTDLLLILRPMKSISPNYELTIKAGFLGYVVQAVVNNFLPLLFVRLQHEFQIPLSRITMLITFNFLLQLIIDLTSAPFIERLGYRVSMLISNAASAAGFILLTVLPGRFADPFYGILTAVCVYAVGGGLQEVLVSPIVEACPSKNKAATMSMLHSFYCWGHVAVVLLSTLFFSAFGIANWRKLALLWCLVPAADFLLFTRVPVPEPEKTESEKTGFRSLASQRLFRIILLMMVCAGASEQAVSQWASAFAEQGLGVSKAVGDLLGPMLFAVCMGISRTIYGVLGGRLDLPRFMRVSVVLCVLSYLIIAFVPDPITALLGCGLTGFSVGIFWPGTFSTAAARIRGKGTLLFALLALAGDLGCSAGPAFAGYAASAMGNNMRAGIGSAVFFPVLLGAGLLLIGKDGAQPEEHGV